MPVSLTKEARIGSGNALGDIRSLEKSSALRRARLPSTLGGRHQSDGQGYEKLC